MGSILSKQSGVGKPQKVLSLHPCPNLRAASAQVIGGLVDWWIGGLFSG